MKKHFWKKFLLLGGFLFLSVIAGKPVVTPVYAQAANLDLKINWLKSRQQRKRPKWRNKTEALLIQKELARVGCLPKSQNGAWGNGSSGAFKKFLKNTVQTSAYSPKLKVSEVLVLFKGYRRKKNKKLTCEPVSGSGGGSAALFAKCDLIKERFAWIRGRDRDIRQSLPTKKEQDAYIGSEQFIYVLQETIKHYDALVKPVSKDMKWLTPQGRSLEKIREKMRSRLVKLLDVIPKTADYWVINADQSCARCINLADFGKLKGKAKFGSTPDFLEETKNSSTESVPLNRITFAMLREQHHNILDWHGKFRAFLNTGSLSDRRQAKRKLFDIISAFNKTLKKPGAPVSKLEERAATYFDKRDELCIGVKVAWP